MSDDKEIDVNYFHLDGIDDFLLPSWAEKLSDGNHMEEGAQLCTKDGRKIGNAIVVGVTECENSSLNDPSEPAPWARILTDRGHEAWMCVEEMEKLFHPPSYIVKKELWRLVE